MQKIGIVEEIINQIIETQSNDIKKEIYSKNNIALLGIMSSSWITLLNSADNFELLCTNTFCFNKLLQSFMEIRKTNKQNVSIMYNSIIEKSDLYVKYQEFVQNLANFMNSYNFKDPLDIGLFYFSLLNDGIFSINQKFNFHKYKLEHSDYHTVMGARICSGKAVCRHVSKNLIDLYSAMGYNSITLLVKGLEKESPFLKLNKFGGPIEFALKNLKIPFINHMNVGIASDKGRFILDPTFETISEFRYNEKENNNLATIIYGFCKEENYYISNSSYNNNINSGNTQSKVSSFLNTNPRKFETEEICNAVLNNELLFLKERENNIKCFRNDNLKLINDIAILYNNFYGYYNDEDNKTYCLK